MQVDAWFFVVQTSKSYVSRDMLVCQRLQPYCMAAATQQNIDVTQLNWVFGYVRGTCESLLGQSKTSCGLGTSEQQRQAKAMGNLEWFDVWWFLVALACFGWISRSILFGLQVGLTLPTAGIHYDLTMKMMFRQGNLSLSLTQLDFPRWICCEEFALSTWSHMDRVDEVACSKAWWSWPNG